MGKLQNFQISFDNTTAVYSEGQVVSGKVIIKLSAPMEMRGITFRCVGKSEVNWCEEQSSSSSNSHSDTVTYTANEIYFNHCVLLWGKGTREKLPGGEHIFPFTYTLPMALPSSFEGTHGHVRYYCKVNIDRPWKFDATCKVPFTIIAFLDLNQQTTALNSAIGQNHKRLCCLCCRSGPLSAVATIPRVGYVPGESIYLTAEINNLTKRVMDKTKAVLKAVITYHATTKSRTETKDLCEVRKGKIERGQSDEWNGVPIPIPPVPPSYLIGCRIIDIHYKLDFIVDPAGPSLDMIIELPILIGNVPLRNYHTCQPPPPYSEAKNYPKNVPDYPDIPPPSYAESVFGKNNILEKDDCVEEGVEDLMYGPVYPYYSSG